MSDPGLREGGGHKNEKKFFAFLDELAHSEQFWKDRENDLPWVKIQSVYLYMFYKNL